ncbi:MAG TPA: hypothetical protein VMY88_05480, partial [Acidimicrobiales bacterium]|nr:hypothetical protein [Acidimicrobiales bacterium]
GNFSSLGLGSSRSIGTGADTGGGAFDQGGSAGGRAVKIAGTKKCVGDPPRQTEDPASPPCVASYSGDNGGATYNGVTRDEVRVLIYLAGGFTRPSSRGSESSPSNVCYDLGLPPAGEEDMQVRFNRAMQRYFNERFQTYGRFVRFIHCFDSSRQATVEGRKAAAAEHYAKWKPFAVVNQVGGQGGSNSDIYGEVMARKGVLTFSALAFQPAALYSKFPGLNWAYLPSMEEYAEQYSSFVCQKVVPHPVTFSGNADDQGSPRRLGLLYTDNIGYPELQAFARLVRDNVTACGGQFVAEGRYPFPYTIGVNDERVVAAQTNMAAFQDAGVTTVIWPGGWESDHTKAAAGIGYRPEWVVAGDGEIEGYDLAQFQEPSVWEHAWVVTNQTREDSFEQNMCYQALREAEPEFPRVDAEYACPLRRPYESYRQLFTGIQVAGPKLHPKSVDKGYHAIPALRSDDPRVPACFYEAGDYTCVKDATAMWWDSNAPSRNNHRGCWKMPNGGRRYLAGTWPEGDVLTLQNRAQDVCNGWAASVFGS